MKYGRRQFLGMSAASIPAGMGIPYVFTSDSEARAVSSSPNEQIGIGSIGMRYQGSVITEKARAHGPIVAIADVDRHVREQARASFGSTPKIYEDYRALLDNPAVNVVLIATPDHWHVKMVIDAIRAGKDVYIEKPLTLTIDEGKILRKIAAEEGRVIQVGSWQRSDHRFRLAVEMVRGGRIGKLQKITCATGPNPTGGPFPVMPVPEHFNWDLWQGQAPDTPYIPQRSHYTFRWWYEYAGGKMTDWGAHDLDIGQWAIGEDPIEIDGRGEIPNTPDGYNVASSYSCTYRYPSGVEMVVANEGRSGILFEGDEGRMFVNRGLIDGVPVEQLAENPFPRESFGLYEHDNLELPERVGKLDAIVNHMANFFECIEKRWTPISDIESQHRSATTCHLGNISMRLGRPIKWDAEKEEIVGDEEANGWLKREQREGYEVS